MRYIIGGTALALTLALAGCGSAGDDAPPPAPPATQAPAEVTPPPAEPAAPEMTTGQQQATQRAESYMATGMGFSRQGLIDQLVFDKFAVEDATFAVDNLGADWAAEAAKKAESYIATGMGFSRQGMIDQLVFDKFTQAEAEAGATAVGL